ncbi:MAG: hypothetical protein A2Z72_08630 [Omnitrophica bacterium RBG_13_46_9]|nr:MAG: hypothetical protein A2Z72_08630 [Omnitrophica bacterium RBG_13_46_9]
MSVPIFSIKGYEVPDAFVAYGEYWQYSGVDDRIGLAGGYIGDMFDDLLHYQIVDMNGNQTYYEVRDEFGETIFVVTPREDGSYNRFTSYGEYEDAMMSVLNYEIDINDTWMELKNVQNGSIITLDGSKVIDLSIINSEYGFQDEDIEILTGLNEEEKVKLLETFMFFGNGFSNEGFEGELPRLMQLFRDDLIADEVISSSSAFGITLYENANLFENCKNWSKSAWLGDETLKNEIILEVETFLDGLSAEQRDGRIGYFSHSGHFNPLIQAINERQDFDIDTIINYEGPYIGNNVIDNTNIKRIININGTASPITVDNPYKLITWNACGLYIDATQLKLNDYKVPFLTKAEFTSNQGIENINFEIKNARHSDFSYDPLSSQSAEHKEVNRATSYFVKKLSEAAIDDNLWNEFILSPGITYDEDRHIYVVDPIKFEEAIIND